MNAPPLRDAVETAGFTPGVRGRDACARYWMGQVALRLRREICWLWRRAPQEERAGALPPLVDRSLAALDLTRYECDKRRFFAEDPTARFLTERIEAAPAPTEAPARGSFGWAAERLGLAPVERFLLALALLPAVDGAAGPVVAACLDDPARTAPTLALAQRLWDEPDALLACFDPAHPLFSHGLIEANAQARAADWDRPLGVAALVARELLAPGEDAPGLRIVAPEPLPAGLAPGARARVAAALAGERRALVPLLGAPGAALAGAAAALAQDAGATLARPGVALRREELAQAMTTAWLRGHALYVDAGLLSDAARETIERPPLPALPLAVLIGAANRDALRGLAEATPPIEIPALSYEERLAVWRAAIDDPALAPILPETARRFRYERPAIARVGAELARLGRAAEERDLFEAARADLDLGGLAQKVTPRFSRKELMLAPARERQIDEIVRAMRNLTRAHHEWGTARAWSESGLAALFAGPSGAGKTMAAEVIAAEASLPLYRIDLSQVVNKYIGETEKNLRRLFDAADAADVVLFFDEADALFGKRSEVKDSHDRYANLEIGYLLERMERFKGLAILATNRRKDLDEAFLRRLRFVVEFVQPSAEERLRIWRAVIPEGVDASGLDFEFLAQRFPLAGGHIRSIVFQALLQCAEPGAAKALDMPAVIRAVQREYDKLERASSLEQYGPYAALAAAERTQK